MRKVIRKPNIILFVMILFATIWLLITFQVANLSQSLRTPGTEHPGFQTVQIADRDTEVKEELKKEERKELLDGKKIAIAITVTKDGPYLDGAAVLVQSVIETKSKYAMDIVAIVHPGVQTTRQSLKDIGFKVIEFAPPIRAEDIRGEHLRKTIDNSGCCGSLELLKLRAYELVEYHRVLLLDMDSMLIKNIDHLFEADDQYSLQFTWDHAMDNKNSGAPPVQGGFLLLKPDETVFSELMEVVREGDFRPGLGWGGSKIGWCWGGQTVQGLLAYYYTIIRKANGLALDDCKYNAMETLPERCKAVPFEEVYSAHFTVCQKPWECHRGREGFCQLLHSYWWGLRQHLEAAHDLNPSAQCCRGCSRKHYETLPLPFKRKIWDA